MQLADLRQSLNQQHGHRFAMMELLGRVLGILGSIVSIYIPAFVSILQRRLRVICEGVAELPILELPDGVLGHIATISHEPSEILNLALTCQGLQNICEGVARAAIDGATEEEWNNLPQVNLPTTRDLRSPGRSCSFGNWGLISKYQQILKHREGLKFDQIVGCVEYSDSNDMSKITCPYFSNYSGFGVSNRIMRSGVHRATFKFSGQGMVDLGIARPMDYKRIALYGYQYTYPSAEPVTEKYPGAWRDEATTNAV